MGNPLNCFLHRPFHLFHIVNYFTQLIFENIGPAVIKLFGLKTGIDYCGGVSAQLVRLINGIGFIESVCKSEFRFMTGCTTAGAGTR